LAISEAALIAHARSDPAAFGELYERHVDRIYSYVFHRVGNPADAEDLTARTFYRALVAMRSYEDHGAPFSAWLYRIAHNLVANWHRDQSRHLTVPLEGLESEPSEESLASRALVAEAVAAAVRSLDADRQAMLLMKFQGLSNAEIAASLGRSEGAVKSLYHRTLADLRELLDGQNGTAPAVPGNGAKHHDDE
jgi:RNA polymerase sigma-70 factor (ECF subfamily)